LEPRVSRLRRRRAARRREAAPVRNLRHGLLTVGASVADAFLAMYLFETTCAIQLRAQGGGELVHVDPRIIATAQQQAAQVTKNLGGQLAWPGLLRKLDRMDPSFRE